MGNNSTEDWIKFCRRAVAGTLVASCYWLSYCYRWEMTTERIGTNFCRASCSPILSFARGLEPKDKEIGPNFAGELLSELFVISFFGYRCEITAERIGPKFAGELFPELW